MTNEQALYCPICRAISGRSAEIENILGSLQNHYRPKVILGPGQALFKENQVSQMVYAVHSGEVKLTRMAPGAPQVLRLVASGEIFGHRAAISGEPYALSAQAADLGEVCSISHQLFHHLLRADAQFSGIVLRQLAESLRLAEDHVVSLSHDSVRRRCAKLLLTLRRPAEPEEKDGSGVYAGLRRLEMAQMIGTTPETLSRTLHSLAKQQLIEISRTKIRIIDPGALHRVAGSTTA